MIIKSNTEDLYKTITNIFDESQKNTSVYDRNYLLLRNIFKQNDLETFLKALHRILQILIYKEFKYDNPYPEKAINFLVLFCTSLEMDELQTDAEEDTDESSFISSVFHYLLEHHDLKLDCIRYRVCQIISKLLEGLLGANMAIDLCTQLEEAMIDRIKDGNLAVALQAVSAGSKLQDVQNSDCPMIQQLIICLTHPKSQMRKACVEKLAIRRDVLAHLVERVRDTDFTVRIAAFTRIGKLVKALKVCQRQMVIKSGLRDSSQVVRENFENKFLHQWLEIYDNEILKFIKALRLDATEQLLKDSTECIEGVLRILFKQKMKSEVKDVLNFTDKLLAIDELNWETARFWRFAVDFFREGDLEDSFTDEILPELGVFCKYILDFCSQTLISRDSPEQQFILGQLFKIAQGYELIDPVHRKMYNELIHNVLVKQQLNEDVITTIVCGLENSFNNIQQQTEFITEVGAAILYETETVEEIANECKDREFQIAEIRVKLDCARNNLTEAIENEDYDSAGKYKLEIKDLMASMGNLRENRNEEVEIKKTTDCSSITKYLYIVSTLLESAKITQLTPTLRMIKEDVIEPYLAHKDHDVSYAALKCYNLCCVIDHKTAAVGIHLLSTSIITYYMGGDCDSRIITLAIKGISDLILLYGTELLGHAQGECVSESMNEHILSTLKGGTPLTNLIRGLVETMNDEDEEVQFQAAKILCQLILHERVDSHSLISRMIIAWSNPAQENDRVNQIIGKMLEMLPGIAGVGDNLVRAFIRTVNTILKAPKGSSLIDVNIVEIAKYMIYHFSSSDKQIQTNLAFAVLFEMQKNPSYKHNMTYGKILLHLEIPDNDLGTIESLIKTSTNLRDEIKDKSVVNSIVKFIAYLNILKEKKLAPIEE